MVERPILMSPPMVQQTLSGLKGQTRRPITDHPGGDWVNDGYGRIISKHPKQGKFGLFVRRGVGTDFHQFDIVPCRFGQPGDQLWVRENGWERPERTPKMMRNGADTWAPYYYDADGITEADAADFKAWRFKRRPSIHMPRWASRISLEITHVRAERLQDISEADCIAEGCPGGHGAIAGYAYYATPLEHFHWLWNEINGAGAWELNPWVWAIGFKVIKP
jgi:hypothetical protein